MIIETVDSSADSHAAWIEEERVNGGGIEFIGSDVGSFNEMDRHFIVSIACSFGRVSRLADGDVPEEAFYVPFEYRLKVRTGSLIHKS